ncbi:transcription factor bHLH110-like isoform X3 [Cornus florida]|uniref:transcription factor bHLH110-like isoform X3 n=1 Tax=Cornus florida TaxID=4283 RepID=UPI00289AB7A0|nr:transcription factor bHLH110-like isoform X3 [Cornus florida]
MESANLHHQHQLQDQLASSSALATSSCYGVGNTHAWSAPKTILNNGNFDPTINGLDTNSRDSRQQNDILTPSLPMIQDLGFHWSNNGAGSFSSTQSAHEFQLAKVNKEELSADSYPKFTEMINSASSIEDYHLNPTTYIKNEQKGHLNDLSEKLLLRNFSSGCQISGLQLSGGTGDYYSNAQNCASTLRPSRGNFSQIFPTVNISNLNQSSSAVLSPSDVNLQALDLFTSAKFCGNLRQPSHGHLDLSREGLFCGLDHMQQSSHTSNGPTKMPPFTNGVTEAKRTSSFLEPKAPQTAAKRSRFESRASCPPLKVRKEKLGDRIAALQQLVAPFGKTDTASVLMEAIGYIKFLQNQVETLSVPYMKSSPKKTSRTMRGGTMEDDNEEAKRDLRSRGLCLVPLSYLSYVTDTGGVWSPPNFSGTS